MSQKNSPAAVFSQDANRSAGRYILDIGGRMIGQGAILVGLILTPLLTLAASFDCGKAGTWTEKTICTSPRLSELDVELDRLYRDALSRTPDVGGAKDEMRSIQRGWLRDIRNTCSAQTCLEAVYEQRLAVMREDKAKYEEAKANADQIDRKQRVASEENRRVKAAPKANSEQNDDGRTSNAEMPQTKASVSAGSASIPSFEQRASELYREARKGIDGSKWIGTGIGDLDWGGLQISVSAMPVIKDGDRILGAFLYKRLQANGISIHYASVVDFRSCSPDSILGYAWLYAMQEGFPDRFVGGGQFELKRKPLNDFEILSTMSCLTVRRVMGALGTRTRGGK